MNDAIGEKGYAGKEKKMKKKMVKFDEGSESSDDENTNLHDEYVQSLVQANYFEMQQRCIEDEVSESRVEVEKSKENSPMNSRINNDNSYQLPLSSDVDNNNELISIQLSGQNSILSSRNSDLKSLRLKRKIEDSDSSIFQDFALKHQLQFSNTYNKCFIYKKKPSGTFRLFNCLMFKSQPEFSFKIEIFDMTNQIRITLTSQIKNNEPDKLQQFTYYQAQFKKLMWENNLVAFDEIESINYLLESQSERIGALMKQHKIAQSLPLTPALLETAMEATVNLRQQMIEKAREKNQFYKIRLEQFIDHKLFNNCNLFNLYKRAYMSCQQNYQKCRQQIITNCDKQNQLKYLQIPPQLCLIHTQYPYKSSIDQFMKLNLFTSPTQKYHIIKQTYRLIKDTASSVSTKLLSTQQLFPLLIYVILNSKVNYIYANITLVDHFLQKIQSPQKALINNIYVAIEYITSSWQK